MEGAKHANLNIDALLHAFLMEQKARLSERRFYQYEDVVDLLRHCLNGYGYQHLDEVQQQQFDQAYERGEEAFCRLFGAAEMAAVFPEFLGYFMVRKVMAGPELGRTAGTVIKALGRWLREGGHLPAEKARDAERQGREAASALPRARRLADALARFAELQASVDDDEADVDEGRFTITEIGPERLRLENDAGEDLGLVAVPPEAESLAQPNWSISGALARRRGRWHWVEVWNVYP